MNELKRINKYISESGFCSRREADRLVEAKRVTVNGKLAENGTKVAANDRVEVDKKVIETKKKPIYMAFNKPVGVTSTTDKKDPDNIIDYIGYCERIFHIGRLDKMSEGLIFLTNDGDIVNKILRAGNNHEKEYIVDVNKPITHKFVEEMSNGVKILNTKTAKCKVDKIGNKRFKIILTQGLNRQIRRMCQALDYDVLRLKRIRIMNVELTGIEVGKWRYLTKAEIDKINLMVANSSKTEEASVNNW